MSNETSSLVTLKRLVYTRRFIVSENLIKRIRKINKQSIRTSFTPQKESVSR